MKQVTFALLLTAMILISCKKKTETTTTKTPPPAITSTSYMPLAVGNYWVYDMYQLDTSGTEISMNRTDSIYVEKDTTVGGRKYYYCNEAGAGNMAGAIQFCGKWLADSAGYVFSLGHELNYFYGYNYIDTRVNDTVHVDTTGYQVVYFQVPGNFSNDVEPAGTFSGLAMNTMLRYLNPNPHSFSSVFEFSNYASGVGLCHMRTSFVNVPKTGNVWRLKKYHV